MSRGLGATQRFVLERLYARRHRPEPFAWHAVVRLAAAYAQQPIPSAATVESVRRAVHGLAARGLVDVQPARDQRFSLLRGNRLVARLRIHPGDVERLILARLPDPYLHRVADCVAGLDDSVAAAAVEALVRQGTVAHGSVVVGGRRVAALRRLR